MRVPKEGASGFSGIQQASTGAAQGLLLGGEEQPRIALGSPDSASLELAALGQVVARMTHELNNILTVIMGYADLALQKRLLSETNSEEVIQIKKASERAASLVCHLPAFDRPTAERCQSRHCVA